MTTAIIGTGIAILLSYLPITSSSPLEKAEQLIAIYLAISGILSYKDHIEFYKWWPSSGMHDVDRRGLSTCGYRLFGVIPFPPLSFGVFKLLVCILPLFWTITAVTTSTLLFLLSAILQTILFSQLWAEDSASYHREALMVTFFLYAGCTALPSDYNVASTVITRILKMHIAFIYSFGAWQKMAFSFWRGRAWFTCAPHTLIWKSIWSSARIGALQSFFFRSPRMVAAGGLVILTLEFILPVQVLLWPQYDRYTSLALCSFHLGVYYLQGINYMTYWSTVVVILGAIDAPLWDTSLEVWSSPAVIAASCILLFQVTYGGLMMENLNVNMPPFTCCPMFVNPCTMTERFPQTYLLRGAEEEGAFRLFPRLEWMFPYALVESGVGLTLNDLNHIPYKFVLFGTNPGFSQAPSVQRKYLTHDIVREGSFFLFTNVVLEGEEGKDPYLFTLLFDLIYKLHASEADSVWAQYDPKVLENALSVARAATDIISRAQRGPVKRIDADFPLAPRI